MDANQIIVEALRGTASDHTAAFNAKLTPTVSPERFLGVKSADIQSVSQALLAGELSVSATQFRAALPHPYAELDIIHVHTLNALRDVEQWCVLCEEFLPYIDNWMVTDSFDPVMLRGRRTIGSDAVAEILATARDWLHGQNRLTHQAISSNQDYINDHVNNTYVIRAGILVLLQALQKGHFMPEHLEWVASVRHENYYVHMAVGWYFATAFNTYEHETRPFLQENGHLQIEAHRLAIRKIIESRRTSADNLAWARGKRSELRELAK